MSYIYYLRVICGMWEGQGGFEETLGVCSVQRWYWDFVGGGGIGFVVSLQDKVFFVRKLIFEENGVFFAEGMILSLCGIRYFRLKENQGRFFQYIFVGIGYIVWGFVLVRNVLNFKKYIVNYCLNIKVYFFR